MIRGFENNLDEMKAIDYLDSLDKRILMTREEGKLAQLVIKYKEAIENLTTMTVCGDGKQIKNTAQYKLEKLQDRIDKAIEYIINETTYSACDEMDKLLDILRGNDNDK